MSRRGRIALIGLVLALAALVLPAAASAHAVLLSATPEASATVNAPPAQLTLTYSEAVEPRFAIVSVTDATGRQQTAGPPARSTSNPDTLVVPLHRVAEGWYLVFWRAISADGHPVRGAFTFAVGPNPGPAPQFVIPSTSETAATPALLIARWITFLSAMAVIGLLALRLAIARPAVARVRGGVSLRGLTVAFGVAIGVALVATPVYVDIATAKFALRSAFDLGGLVPLLRSSAFGRGYLDLELALALLAIAAAVAIRLDRPDRPTRSTASLLATGGAALAAAATLLVPGLAGHAAQTSPRGLSLALDWLHLAAGSIWLGGLLGLIVLAGTLPRERRVAGLSVIVPRFSAIAFVSVMAIIGSGTGAALVHLPTLATLWQTSYGKTVALKVILLAAAMLLAGVNLARTTPRLRAAATHPELAGGAALLLRRLVTGEAALVLATLFAAGLLSSLPPPAKALAHLGRTSATVGPGPVSHTVAASGYEVALRIDPNKAAVANAFGVRLTRNGAPVRGADVTATFTMLDMEMGTLSYHLAEESPGLYAHSAPALVMVGRWGLSFKVAPSHAAPFTVLFVDHANG